jgi:hypothetical protein
MSANTNLNLNRNLNPTVNLSCLNDLELHEGLKKKTSEERSILVDVISHIHEADRRRLYLKYNYTSLFDYLVNEMNYHGGSAQRRIDAARLLGEVPEIRPDVASGALNLTQLTAVAQGIKQKLKTESRTDGLPALKQNLMLQRRDLLDRVKNQKLPQVQKIVAETLDIEVKVQERKTMQRDGSLRVELTLTAEQVLLLNKVKSLISHTHSNPSVADLLTIGLNELISKKDPVLKGFRKNKAIKVADSLAAGNSIETDDSSQSTTTSVVVKMRKPIPTATKRKIFEKHRCCQWRNKQGDTVCGSTFQLQLDHIRPVWAGGDNETENLQVLCSRHNKLKYLKEVGRF